MAVGKIRVLAVALVVLVGVVVLIVTGHWITALGVAAAGALTIGGQVWKRWQSRLVEWTDDSLRRLVSRFDRRYREFMLGKVRFIDLKGLITVGFYTPELDEVFIDVSLAYRAPGHVPEGVLAQLPAEVTEQRSIWESLDGQEPRILAIVGVPGSGKTTLLRHTARQLCLRPRRAVPIFLFLRDHVNKIVSRPDVTLLELVRDKLGRLAADEPPGWFEQRLGAGDCVVMLDGLDEVGQLEDRTRVHDWVERQIEQYPANHYVITSRPLGYEHIEGARVLQVRGFTDDQVARFVRSWSHAVERHAAARSTTREAVRQHADQQADDLLERLNGAPALYDLTVNPLLLTMIATVHRERGALPDNRTDLYNEICQVVLWRLGDARRLRVYLSGRKKEVLLRRLAFTMMRQRVRDLPHDDVIAEIDSARQRMAIEVTAQEILTDIRHHGLLVKRENDLYSFAHHTFQEFLAAAYVRDKGLSTVLVDAVDDVWWRETTLLYAAMADADPIMWACLESGGVTALSLALDCADQCRELAPELRERLDTLLASVRTPDAEPGRRRDMTRAMITRHLHQVVRTGVGTEVCSRPITVAIYRLYQQDTDGSASGAEAYWRSGPDEDEPVTGVRPRDVLAFTRWVNDLTGAEPGYRLPARAELGDATVQRALAKRALSAWTLAPDEGAEPVLWAPADLDHPHAVDTATLRRHVRDDIERSTSTVVRLLLLRAFVAVTSLKRAREETWSIDEEYIEEWNKALDHEQSRDHRRLRYLHQDLEAAHTRNHDIAVDLRRIFDAVRRLSPSVPIDHRRASSIAADLGNDLILNFEKIMEDTERPLTTMLRKAVDATADDSSILERVIPIDRHRAHSIAADSAEYSRALDQSLGVALSQALRRVLRRASAPTWSADLSGELITLAGVPDTEFVVSADDLADRIREGCTGMREYTDSWAASVADTLQDTALPVLTWKEPLVADSATAIRLATLCLAAEADVRGADRLRTVFHEIAAGVTFLQRRAAGEGPVTETIILATR